MWIINLEANPNGSHNDHRSDNITAVPDGWAVIPHGFIVPTSFPFVAIETEKVDGIETVTNMIGGVIPEVDPEPVVPTIDERLTSLESENAILKAQINAQSEQMDFYEDCIAEMAMMVYA
jgi:hypothetical protein